MAFTLHEYFQKQGLRVVEAALQRVAGKAAPFVEDEDHYRQTVIQPSWEALPSPIRLMLRRRHDDWTDLFLQMRDRVYDLSSGKVEMRPGFAGAAGFLLQKAFPLDKPGSAPVGLPEIGDSPTDLPPSTPTSRPSAPSPTASAAPADAGEEAEFCPELVVGIDLGTTYSLVAHLDGQGRPCCIPNAHGELLTPSVVLFENDETIVGKEAVLAAASEPERVADMVKRDMGTKHYHKKINGESIPPEVISSLILKSLKADAERKLGEPVTQAVITVPAYFEETRRRATMDAGRLAGLEVLDIINEPTAAAIAYGYQLGFLDRGCRLPGDRPLCVLVFDLGGGTFDVTIVEIQGNAFRALATDGDVLLGGKDWDARLIDLAAERFLAQYQADPRTNPYSMQELWQSAELAKRTLTERKKASLFVNHDGKRLKVEVGREEFEEATAALLERTRMTTEIVVRHARKTWPEIDRVLLVGGSTRMPQIRRMLRELSGKEPDCSMSPDEVVAHGAALYAELLAPRPEAAAQEPAFTVTNVNSHSLGVLGRDPETGREVNKILIPRNSPLPQTVTKLFKTYRENQKSVQIKVLEGESDRPEVCTLIGTCAIRDLPPGLPEGWPVKVRYTYESNGRLHVTAKIKGHKVGVKAEFERENSMPDEDLDMWTHYVDVELHEQPE